MTNKRFKIDPMITVDQAARLKEATATVLLLAAIVERLEALVKVGEDVQKLLEWLKERQL